MVGRSIIVWLMMLIAASANGFLREAVFVPRMGVIPGRAASTLLLCAIVFLIAHLTIRWIGPHRASDAWFVGGLWLALTLAFEFLAGHYLFGTGWRQLLEDYDIAAGRIWILALVTILLAPRWCVHRCDGIGILPSAYRRPMS